MKGKISSTIKFLQLSKEVACLEKSSLEEKTFEMIIIQVNSMCDIKFSDKND